MAPRPHPATAEPGGDITAAVRRDLTEQVDGDTAGCLTWTAEHLD